MKDKNKYDWIVVDADNNWIASWNSLTEQQVQEEIFNMRNEIPTIFKPDVNIYAYKVNKAHEPEIEIY